MTIIKQRYLKWIFLTFIFKKTKVLKYFHKTELKLVGLEINKENYLRTAVVTFKFSDGDGPNLCRVRKVDVSSTFIENVLRSGLTLVSSNDIITIQIDRKKNKENVKITIR